MKIIKPSYEIEDFDLEKMLMAIEKAGRTCYKSEERMTSTSFIPFIRQIIQRGHESVLEHKSITVRIICDRGVSHEWVRHRIGSSYSQESTRYCNYGNVGEVTFIKPFFFEDNILQYRLWATLMRECESTYLSLLDGGASPQEARSVLPNSLKTEIVVTHNLRQWRHFFRLRTHKSAHPQMREITIPLLKDFKERLPVIFEDIEVED